MILWRISDHADLSGVGGLRASGRWHRKGKPVVYLAENVAAAMLEVLVSLEYKPQNIPANYTLLEVAIEDDTAIQTLDMANLPQNWVENRSYTQQTGDRWLADNSALVLKVPSAIIPRTHNFIFNPGHPDASRIRIASETRHPFDPRLFRKS